MQGRGAAVLLILHLVAQSGWCKAQVTLRVANVPFARREGRRQPSSCHPRWPLEKWWLICQHFLGIGAII